jgi:hypothetical protein
MFSIITEEAFNELQVEVGVLLKTFNPASPSTPSSSDIITATTGGITISCTPTYEDFFADVDNAPNNVMEGKRITGWDCKFATTAIGTSPEMIRLSLGAADVTAASGKIEPRRQLKLSDFESSRWWVGDRSDGGLVAIQLKNVLSTGGFSLKTTKNGKGQLAFELTGHVSINAQNEVPMVFYSIEGDDTTGDTTGDTQ